MSITYFDNIYVPWTFTEPDIVDYNRIKFFDKSTHSAITAWEWDFGDGSGISTDQNPIHRYNSYGTYSVSLTTYNQSLVDTYTTSVLVSSFTFGDILFYSNAPRSGYLGCLNPENFELTLYTTATTYDGTVDLYSQLSQSAPYQENDSKYSHLLPQWRFTDRDGNITESITLDTSSLVYDMSGNVAGSRWTGEFNYIDDMPTEPNEQLILWATVQLSGVFIDTAEKQAVPSYTNSRIYAATPYVIDKLDPHHLNITRNGLQDIHPLKWVGVEFPYVITINGKSEPCNCSNIDPILFYYPSSNDFGSLYNISRDALTIPATAEVWSENPIYFQKYDANNYMVGGFKMGSVTLNASSDSVAISASVEVTYIGADTTLPYMWISNPESHTLNRVSAPYVLSQTVISILTAAQLSFPITGVMADIYQVPYLTGTDVFVPSYSGYGGIFGIAVDNCYNVWATDSEMDKVYKFSRSGTLLSSIDLSDGSNIGGASAGCTPAGIMLDNDYNMWITLYDSASVLKFDRDGNYLYTINPSNEIDSLGNISYAPTIGTPDGNNDLWVAYSNNLSSYIVKYSVSDVSAVEDFRLNLPLSSTPMDIVANFDNSIWVTNSFSNQNISGNIQHYDTNGTLLGTYDALNPSFITIDKFNGIWACYGTNNIFHITSGGYTHGFSLSSGAVSPTLNFDIYNDTDLGGITSDSNGNVWVINSTENKLYSFTASTEMSAISGQLYTLNIIPKYYYAWGLSGGNFFIYADPMNRSARAFGDWNGWRWAKMYGTLRPSETINTVITGISNYFTVKEFQNYNVVRRFNESQDIAGTMRYYALNDRVNGYYNFFVNYLGGMLGGNATEDQVVGRISYEKIANFVRNHSDIEECNINQLYSLAQELDVPIDDYKFTYPVDLARIIDICSISHQNLWGARCKCNKNFTNKNVCDNCGHVHCTNLGSIFDPWTYMVTAGIPFVVNQRVRSNQVVVIDTVEFGGDTIYPLSSVNTISWLPSSDFNKYYFYNYFYTDYCGQQEEGVINWEDQYTTLSEHNSSLSAWYGENGIVEEMFNYILHKGLDLNG